MILLDYDGTLVDYNEKPDLAIPDESLIKLIEGLLQLPQTEVAIVSGRDQDFLQKWFGHHPMTLVAEHGYFIKHKNQKWVGKEIQQKNWKEDLIPLLESFTDRTPGTFIEEKRNSLVWHYRKTDPELASERAVELKTVLNSLISDELQIINGDKVIEVVSGRYNKGTAVSEIIGAKKYDFIICFGDDVADEFMFNDLPTHAINVKVGRKNTSAFYCVENNKAVRFFLNDLIS
jgi:trehalose 6-phosphate synthase/phosphatase